MNSQIEKLRELAEDGLATSNVYTAHESLEQMLAIIKEMSTETAESKRERIYSCSLAAENALPEAP